MDPITKNWKSACTTIGNYPQRVSFQIMNIFSFNSYYYFNKKIFRVPKPDLLSDQNLEKATCFLCWDSCSERYLYAYPSCGHTFYICDSCLPNVSRCPVRCPEAKAPIKLYFMSQESNFWFCLFLLSFS